MDERGGRIQQPVQERAKRLTSAEKARRCRQKRAKRCKAAEKKRRQRQKIAEKRKGSKRNADTLERIRECLRRKKLREQPNTNTNALVSIESENSIGESLPSSSDISHLIQKLNSTVLLPDNFQDKLKDLKSSTQKHYLKSTAVDDTNEIHRAPVCVVCDEFIIKLDDMQWIDKDTLLQHSKRLGLKEYEEHHCLILPESLKCQYVVDDPQLKHLLLSPRARRQSNEYMCCTSCKTSLRPHMTEKAPPRLSIANGFAIGKIPDGILQQEEITDILAAMIAPVRPFMHIVSYSGGQHRTIRGNVTFFQNNVVHTGSVLQNYLRTGANPNVYCVMCGRFTPEQREIVKRKMMLNTAVFKELIKWYIEESGHPAFTGLDPEMENWPQPVVLEGGQGSNLTDEEEDPDLETSVEGSTYYFPSAYEPNSETGTFSSQSEFAKSMINETAPTLLFSPEILPVTDSQP